MDEKGHENGKLKSKDTRKIKHIKAKYMFSYVQKNILAINNKAY